jgi:hypothetical protein
MELSSATAKRQPSTAPSAGMACAGPVWAKAQAPFVRWKYPQYRYAAACAGAAARPPARVTMIRMTAARAKRVGLARWTCLVGFIGEGGRAGYATTTDSGPQTSADMVMEPWAQDPVLRLAARL